MADQTPAPQVYIDALNSGSIRQANHAFTSLLPDQYIPLEDLKDSVRNMSCPIPDMERENGYIFASGNIDPEENVGYQKYTKKLSEGGFGLVTIADTKAAQYVGIDENKSSPFMFHLARTLDAIDSDLTVNEVMHGYMNPDGTREPGVWDDISLGYAEHARGKIVTVTPNAQAHRVFMQVELPALLDNEEVESINGVPRLVVADYLDEICRGGTTPEDARLMVDEDIIKLSSIKFMRSVASPDFSHDLGPVLMQDFQLSSPQEEVLDLFKNAGTPNEFLTAPKSVQEVDHGQGTRAIEWDGIRQG